MTATGLAYSYGWLNAGQSVTASNFKWNSALTYAASNLSLAAAGMMTVESPVWGVLDQILGAGNMPVTISLEVYKKVNQFASVAIPVIIGAGAIIDAIGGTITVVIAWEIVKEFVNFKRGGQKQVDGDCQIVNFSSRFDNAVGYHTETGRGGDIWSAKKDAENKIGAWKSATYQPGTHRQRHCKITKIY